MKKVKKTLASLGTISMVSIPMIVAASCGVSKDADNQDITKSISYMKHGLFVDSNEFTPIQQTQATPYKDFLKQNRKIKQGEKIQVPRDMVVLADAYYSGTVQDITTIYEKKRAGAFKNMKSDTPFEYINGSAVLPSWGKKVTNDWRAWKPVVQLGAHDSLLYIFDDDDNDGRSLKGFKKQVMFEDTSIARDKQITALNKMIGLKLKPGKYGQSQSLVPFIGNLNQGVLTSYFGSQNNHGQITENVPNTESDEHMRKRLGGVFPKAVVEAIVNYYKTASKAFKSTEVPFGYIKYEVVGPNAIRVDFSSNPLVTAAHIGQVSQDGKSHMWDAELSIGAASEWNKYNAHEISASENKYMIIGKH